MGRRCSVTLTSELAGQLQDAVRERRNILISGGTGTGKTTLLNALAATIPDADRIVLIEETSEIMIEKPNLVRFEARRAQTPLGQEAPLPAVSIADLLRATLRHRPDRILVGEVRGPEAFDLLQALNTGHLGSMSTIHANSAEQALTRFSHCVLTANVGLPHASTREAIAFAIDLVAHVARQGSRRVSRSSLGSGATTRGRTRSPSRRGTRDPPPKTARSVDLSHPPAFTESRPVLVGVNALGDPPRPRWGSGV